MIKDACKVGAIGAVIGLLYWLYCFKRCDASGRCENVLLCTNREDFYNLGCKGPSIVDHMKMPAPTFVGARGWSEIGPRGNSWCTGTRYYGRYVDKAGKEGPRSPWSTWVQSEQFTNPGVEFEEPKSNGVTIHVYREIHGKGEEFAGALDGSETIFVPGLNKRNWVYRDTDNPCLI